MTRQETAQILAILRAGLPKPAIGAEQYKSMVRVWGNALADIPLQAALSGADEIIKTAKWFPAVSELREAALEFTDQQAIQDAADRVLAEKLRISWRCCPVCQVGPMVHGVCPQCVDKIVAAEVPQLEAR